jgi:hypothetical protein
MHGRTPLPAHLLATRFPQKEILQDELPIAGGKRSTANPARYFTVNARLQSGFGFDDLIKRIATGHLKWIVAVLTMICPLPGRIRCYLFSSATQREAAFRHWSGAGFPQFMHRVSAH